MAAAQKMEEYDEVNTFIESGNYPAGLSKDGKRNWRRKCKENFKIESGQLFYKKGDLKPFNKGTASATVVVISFLRHRFVYQYNYSQST